MFLWYNIYSAYCRNFFKERRNTVRKEFVLCLVFLASLTACAGQPLQISSKTIPPGATRIYATPPSFLDKTTWKVIFYDFSRKLFRRVHAFRPPAKDWCAPGRVCVTLTICADPHKTVCQTIDDIMIDTGSVGLRLSEEALSPALVKALRHKKYGHDKVTSWGLDDKKPNIDVEYRTAAYIHGTLFDNPGPRTIYVMHKSQEVENMPIFELLKKMYKKSRFMDTYEESNINGILGIGLTTSADPTIIHIDPATIIANTTYKIVFSKDERSGYIEKLSPQKAATIINNSLVSKNIKKICCDLVDTGTSIATDYDKSEKFGIIGLPQILLKKTAYFLSYNFTKLGETIYVQK